MAVYAVQNRDLQAYQTVTCKPLWLAALSACRSGGMATSVTGRTSAVHRQHSIVRKRAHGHTQQTRPGIVSEAPYSTALIMLLLQSSAATHGKHKGGAHMHRRQRTMYNTALITESSSILFHNNAWQTHARRKQRARQTHAPREGLVLRDAEQALQLLDVQLRLCAEVTPHRAVRASLGIPVQLLQRQLLLPCARTFALSSWRKQCRRRVACNVATRCCCFRCTGGTL